MGAVAQVIELVITLVMGLSLPVKMAWIVWLLWAAAQVLWFRHSPAPEPALSLSIAPPRPRPREVPPKRKSSSSLAVAPYGMSDFAAALDHEQQQRAATATPSRATLAAIE